MSNAHATVVIVEDDEATCEVIATLLESVRLQVKIYKNPTTFLKDFNESFTGCLLLDIRMPEINGFDLFEVLKLRYSQLPVIFLTAFPDVSLAVRLIKAGAFDFIQKPFNNQMLLSQIQRAIAISPIYKKRAAFLKQLELLTPREEEVLLCIIAGNINSEIAKKLNITSSTVEQHRANFMKKMQVKNISDLIKNYLLAKYILLTDIDQGRINSFI